jgi:diguanylate cyclase (GGDEF)-like protein/PAS domain S-box-containing protein
MAAAAETPLDPERTPDEAGSLPTPPRLDAFLELGLDLMAVVEVDGTFVWGNQALRDAIETADRPLVGSKIETHIHPDDLAATAERMTVLTRGERVRGFRNRYRFVDGGYRVLEWYGVVHEGRIYATARDVTPEVEARRAETEARRAHERSERFYRDIVDSQADLIVRVDADNRFLFVNEAYCRTFGKTREELIGSSFAPLVHQEDLPATLAAMETLRDPPHRCTLTQRAMTVDGWRWFVWDDRAFVDESGSIVEIQGVGHDVTELKEAESRALRQHRSLEAAASIARIGRWDFDHVRDRLTWSDSVYAIFGVDPDDFDPTFEAFLDTVHPDDRAFVRNAFETALERREPYDIEHRVLRRDGSVAWLHEKCDVDYDEAGRPLRSVGVVQDITYRKTHDALTGLPNPVLLHERLEEALRAARAAGDLVAVVSIDIDRFADLNGHFGRSVADRLLGRVADRIADVLGGRDRIARSGGDEFLVLIGGLATADAGRQWAERIATELRRPWTIEDARIHLTSSIGVALYPLDDANAETLLRHADLAMHLAKSRGRDRVVVYDPDTERRETEENARRTRLRRALLDDEFVLHVQPKVSLLDGRIRGVEALVRWNDPEHGLRPPSAFLPDVLGRPLELDLGRWAIERALAMASSWRRDGVAGEDWNVSVNIGGHQLLTPGFVEDVAAALELHPELPSGTLMLEVVETAALADVERARSVLARCRGLGVQVALDDFGTGYSSLSYFRNLPIDVLKIDLSFVQNMLDNASDLGIVQSVIGLARAFDRGVVAEGVESRDHAVALAALGADAAQGYVIARPMDPEAYPAWAEGWRREHRFDGLAAELDVAVDDLPIRVAVRSHVRWIDALRAYDESGGRTLLPPMDRDACAFGTWYHGSGVAGYGKIAGFTELGRLHDKVHRLAERLVERIGRDDAADERAALLDEIDATQRALTTGLEELIRTD